MDRSITQNDSRYNSKQFTPTQSPTAGTRFIPLIQKCKGRGDEIIYAPECLVCQKPILDLKSANIATVNDWWEDFELIPIAPESGIFGIPGYAYAIHKECDDISGRPWTNADNVIKRDQRWSWEKRA
jgi:hypothetical protein